MSWGVECRTVTSALCRCVQFHAEHVLVSVPHGIDSQTYLGSINEEIRCVAPSLTCIIARHGQLL